MAGKVWRTCRQKSAWARFRHCSGKREAQVLLLSCSSNCFCFLQFNDVKQNKDYLTLHLVSLCTHRGLWAPGTQIGAEWSIKKSQPVSCWMEARALPSRAPACGALAWELVWLGTLPRLRYKGFALSNSNNTICQVYLLIHKSHKMIVYSL